MAPAGLAHLKTAAATVVTLVAGLLLAPPLIASDLDEFKVKRQQVFEFTQKPAVTRDGDTVTITFVSKGYCDATVAIEDANGKIVRHLASGVLGPNAPVPFRKNSKKQTIVWDGKDDLGKYVDDKDSVVVRVSLGLKPRFERSLFWSPHKRISDMPILVTAPEGLYVYEGHNVDHIRLFDRDGRYVKTVYPFPASQLKNVKGLRWHDFPQGYRRPLKESSYRQTLLTSGTNDEEGAALALVPGHAATGMAVNGERLAIAFEHLNRLSTSRSSGGLPLKGPKTGVTIRKGFRYNARDQIIGPSSMAFSLDGKVLYLTGYLWRQHRYMGAEPGCRHVVMKLDFESDAAPTVFAGSMKPEEHGTGNDRFRVPTTVDVDAQGRVYVADFLNDRVQVFKPDGSHLRTIRTPGPAKVAVHKKTREIYVFSWTPIGVPFKLQTALGFDPRKKRPTTLTRFAPLPNPRKLSEERIELGAAHAYNFSSLFEMGQVYQIALDSWSDPPTIWVVGRKHRATQFEVQHTAAGFARMSNPALWKMGIRALRRTEGQWKVACAFDALTAKAVVRLAPPRHNIQQCYVSPKTGKLFLGEADSGPTWKAYKQLLEINPETGRVKPVNLPFNALDVAFDRDGLIYLRTTDVVARYNPETWREVPWDYGSELRQVTSGGYGRAVPVVSGLIMPSRSPVCFHQGGMSVSPKGYLIAACHNRVTKSDRRSAAQDKAVIYGKPYKPRIYPGREESSTSCCVHVWDRHGKVVYEDAVPGLPMIDGVFMDERDDIYAMATPTRVHDGKTYFNPSSSTLTKFRPKRGKIVTGGKGRSPLPLSEQARSNRPPDLYRLGPTWVDGAEWFYGGVGWAGFNVSVCGCWFARFALDYFARSVAPEPDQYSVAVLDSAGNLVLRIGQYGNVDDGVPLVGKGGPSGPRRLGSDEVGLFHACFVGTHTDRRLFIADHGNARIVSVKLGYHATERVALKDVPEGK